MFSTFLCYLLILFLLGLPGMHGWSQTKIKEDEILTLSSYVVTGNMRSSGNKINELGSLTMNQWEHCVYSIMCYTETWLQEHILDSNSTISGFQTVRADKECKQSSKRGRGD